MNPTSITVVMNVETARAVDLPRVSINVTMSMLIPASNRMMFRAMMLIKGERLKNVCFSKMPKTGPRRMPSPRSQTMSGIFVLV